MSDVPEFDPTLELDTSGDPLRRDPIIHRWWARRGRGASAAVVMLTQSPGLAANPEKLQQAVVEPESVGEPNLSGLRLLDLCSGVGTVAGVAQRLRATVTAVDSHPIPNLIGRATLVYPMRYAAPVDSLPGVSPNGSWSGLANEVQHWSAELRRRLAETAGNAWLPDVFGVLCKATFKCAGCGCVAILDQSGADRAAFSLSRQSRQIAVCPGCGASTPRSEMDRVGISVTAAIAQDGEANSVTSEVMSACVDAQYPTGFETRGDRPWAKTRTGSITFRQAHTARQAKLIVAMRDAFRSVRDELADQEYSPAHASAVLTYLALGLSGIFDLLTTMARWHPQLKIARGLERPDWTKETDFVEVGGAFLDRRLAARFDQLCQVIADSDPSLAEVDVRAGDMRKLEFSDAEFDLAIWDPPYYDNVNYDAVALPFSRFLQSLVGDLDPGLMWPGDSALTRSSTTFSREEYETGLSEAAREIARVLKPGGRLGMFWFQKSAGRLDELLSVLGGQGLELVETVGLRTENLSLRRSAHEEKPVLRQLLLVFRRAQGGQPVDAVALLDNAYAARPVMYAGLVKLLASELDEEEIDDLIPDEYRGTTEQRLAELALSHPEPKTLLDRIPKRALREFVAEREENSDLINLSRQELVDKAFLLLGWQVPRVNSFAIGRALDEAAECISRLRLAHGEQLIRGEATAAFDRIERVLKFCVVAWASRVDNHRWRDVVAKLTDRSEKLLFGHWYRAFVELPKRYASEDHLLGQANRYLRRAKVFPELEKVLALRNRVAHLENEHLGWSAFRDEIVGDLEQAMERMRIADSSGAFPQVLQPISETRDPYGRITLRLTDYKGHHVEFLMTEHTDLTRPIVYLRSEVNPREVDPVRMDAAEIAERAGVVRVH
jgi:SAM-dependent methyltransferase